MESLLALCIEEKARPPQEEPKAFPPSDPPPRTFCQSLKGAEAAKEGLNPMQREARDRVAFCLWHRGMKGGTCENARRLTGCMLWDTINRHGRRYHSVLQEIRYRETLTKAKTMDRPETADAALDLYHQAEEIFDARVKSRETE